MWKETCQAYLSSSFWKRSIAFVNCEANDFTPLSNAGALARKDRNLSLPGRLCARLGKGMKGPRRDAFMRLLSQRMLEACAGTGLGARGSADKQHQRTP